VVRVPGYRSRGRGFDSRFYHIFWEVVGLERGPLSLVSTIEELLERKNSVSGLENREYAIGDPPRWLRDTLHPQTLALTSPTSGCHSVGIVGSRTQAIEFFFCFGTILPFTFTSMCRNLDIHTHVHLTRLFNLPKSHHLFSHLIFLPRISNSLDNLDSYVKKKTPWSESASELCRPSDRRLPAK
jgi:hypothetical protein